MKEIVNDLSLIIASTGRREVLKETVESIFGQPYVPEQIILVGVTVDDLPDFGNSHESVEMRLEYPGIKSSSTQRNAGLRCLKGSTRYVAFLDDDCELHQDYFKEVKTCFEKHPEVVAFSGNVIRNGKISREEARKLLDEHTTPSGMPNFGYLPERWPGLYGCAMNARRSALEKENFDEELVRYALGEDTELGFRMKRHGDVGGSARCVMVHLAHKSGRGSEVSVGYSQIANFHYFVKKGIGFPRGQFIREHLLGLPIKNFLGFLRRDDRSVHDIDRRGRFIGNCLAWRDLLMGRLHPRRINEISNNSGRGKLPPGSPIG